MIITTKDHTRR